MTEGARFLDFGRFRLDRRERLLYAIGDVVSLPPKAADLLVALTDEPGRLYSKEELIARVWPDVVVDESNLTQSMFLLRKTLDDDGSKWIITVPRRGYRFAAEPSPSPARAQRRRLPAFAIAAGLAVVIIAAATWLFVSRKNSGATIRTIAVLPFQSVDGNRGDRIFQLGMADTLINKLSQIRGIAVSPTHAVTPYLDSRADALAAGRDLGVTGVVEGNFQHEGHRLRCTVRLLRVADGTAVWADRYDDDDADLFALEDRIAGRVLTALDIRLSPRQQNELRKRYTSNRAAYDLYLRGRLEWESFSAEGLQASVRYFNSALQLDPNYALAYAGLAKTYSVMAISGLIDENEAWSKSRDAAIRALELDPTIGEAHTPLAAAAIFHDRNWSRADEETRRALELDPTCDAHSLRAYLLQATGHADAAVVELRREREIDPLWLVAQNDCIIGLFRARRYAEAVAEGLQLLKLQPNDRTPRYYVGKSLRMLGRLDEAALQQETVLKTAPDFLLSIGELGAIAAQRGNRAEAEMRIAQIEKLRPSERRRRAEYALATLYAALGDRDRVFEALGNATRNHYPFVWEVRTDASFDSLRADARYQDLLAKMNL